MPRGALRQLGLALRWSLWTIPSAVIAAPLAVLLASLFAGSVSSIARELSQLLTLEHLAALAFGAMVLVPFYVVAILGWAALALRFPQIDQRGFVLVLGFPVLVAVLFTFAAVVIYNDGFTWLAIPVPLCIGIVPLAARLLDPRLRIGAFADPTANTIAG